MDVLAIDLAQLRVLGELVLAMALGAVVGWEREVADKPAGLRTHMLIAGAAALFVALGNRLLAGFAADAGRSLVQADPLRIVEAVVAGVSFLGAGTIIRGPKGQVEGLTTAASLLFTAALGVSVAVSLYVIAVGATLLLFVTLRFLLRLEAAAKGVKE
jgi:putative Mg2+ transporter-C (MgtC) family protein